jgi:methylmalonyl-CoA mutase, N-terminal domain
MSREPALPPDLAARLGEPGAFPYTRGIHPRMYADGRLWTMRQYAGFGGAEESNARYRHLLGQGVTGLSVAFDLPTQLGLDPDDPRARGEVGRVGVSIATVDDMRTLFDGIPLAEVTTSMTINAPAMMLLALYTLEAERQGTPPAALGGTVQNDVLKEYVARGTYIYPPGPSMRLVTDLMRWCAEHAPRWNTISVSGYHMREAGCTAAQEVAFTLADAVAYVRAADRRPRRRRGGAAAVVLLRLPRRAVRGGGQVPGRPALWAHLARDLLGARDERTLRLRFHTQTGGSTLTAQQPLTNVVRTAYQALAAVLGGTQSLHTNAFDEALGLPTAASATLALRTQQVLAFETGVTDAVDPLAGSVHVEALTDAIEAEARRWFDEIEALGGAVAAIEAGFLQGAIEDAAYAFQRAVESGARVVVGVNRFVDAEPLEVPVQAIDPGLEPDRVAAVARFREGARRRRRLRRRRAAGRGGGSARIAAHAARPRCVRRAGDAGRGVRGAARRVGRAPGLSPAGPAAHRPPAAHVATGRSWRRPAARAARTSAVTSRWLRPSATRAFASR